MAKWRLKQYLDANGLSAYQLVKATDAAPNTVYALARGDQKQVNLKTLEAVLTGLDALTGKRASFDDLLERS